MCVLGGGLHTDFHGIHTDFHSHLQYNGSFVHPYSLSVSLTISLHLSAFVSDFLCLSSFETGARYVFLRGLELTEIHSPLFSVLV